MTNPATEVQNPSSQTYVKLVGYTLDGLGNRSQIQTTLWGGAPATVTYASDVVNQYTTIGAVSRTHDNNGNLTDDGTNTYVYDYENHLIEVKLKSTGASIAAYKYDALGRRVERAVNGGATTRYVLRRQQVIEEWDGSDNWAAEYVYEDGIDRPRAMDRADVADVDGDSNTTEILRFHYHQNALSSTSEMTEPGGAVVEWVTYDVYGAPSIRDQQGTVVAQSAIGNPYLYTGREHDPESGKYFYRARTYDPSAGRFIQRDPLGYVDGLSLYRYARANPASLVDPDGLHPGDPDDPFKPSPGDPRPGADGGPWASEGYSAEDKARVRDGKPTDADLKVREAEKQKRIDEYKKKWKEENPDAMGPMGGPPIPPPHPEDDSFGANFERFLDAIFGIDERYDGMAINTMPSPFARGSGLRGGRTRCPSKGGENSAAKVGRAKHKEFAEKVKKKPGWRSEPQNLVDPKTGNKVVPDAVSPKGRPVELKPNTPSGRRAGKTQLTKYERALGKKGKVVTYEPKPAKK